MKMHLKDLRFEVAEDGEKITVIATHLPTRFSAECSDLGSEERNKKKATKLLAEMLKGLK